MTREREREAAARGAALLDERMPGWANKVDLGRLNLYSTSECVLGQLFAKSQRKPQWQAYGYPSLQAALDAGYTQRQATQRVCVANYTLGTIVLELSNRALVSHGFDSGPDTTFYGLDRAWEAEIRARQS
jgi:hypothetical protein